MSGVKRRDSNSHKRYFGKPPNIRYIYMYKEKEKEKIGYNGTAT